MSTQRKGAKKAPSKKPASAVLQEFGEQVLLARNRQRLKKYELVQKSGVSEVTITNLEKGKLQNVTFDVLVKIGEALGMEVAVTLS